MGNFILKKNSANIGIITDFTKKKCIFDA